MRAYIISLNSATDARNKSLSDLLVRNGFAPHFVTAIRGSTLDASIYFSSVQSYFWSKQRLMTPSELGCALSHVKAHEAFLRTGDSAGLFLEDDVILDDAGCANIKRLAQTRVPENGLVHLGGLEGISPALKYLRGQLVQEDPKLFKIEAYDLGLLTRMAGYMIAPPTASKLRDAISQAPFVIDDFRYMKRNIGISDFYFSNIVEHPEHLSHSSIEPERALMWASPAYANNIWGLRAAVERSLRFRLDTLTCDLKRLTNMRRTVRIFVQENVHADQTPTESQNPSNRRTRKSRLEGETNDRSATHG